MEMFIPVTQTPVKIKNMVVTVTTTLSPDFLQPPVISAGFLRLEFPYIQSTPVQWLKGEWT